MNQKPTDSASVLALIRPELLQRSPYVAGVPDRDAIRLHANENPWSIDDGDTMGSSRIEPTSDILKTLGSVASNSDSFHDSQTKDQQLNRYPQQRPANLVEKMADYYGVEAECVLPVRGGDDGIDLVIRAFCRAGKDSIQISSPAFGMYASYAQIQDAAVVDVPLIDSETGFSLDMESVISQGKHSKLIFLCSPNNPTGNSLSIEQVSRVCSGLSGVSVVVLDEAYIEFSSHQSAVSLLSEYPNLIIVRTLSKALGAAGLRCGALLAHPDIVAVLQGISTPYALPTPIVELAIAGFEPAQLQIARARCEFLIEHCAQLAEALIDHPLVDKLYPSDANFLLVRFRDADNVYRALKDQGVLVRNFSASKGCEGCLRISVGKEEENRKVLKVLDQLAPKASGVGQP